MSLTTNSYKKTSQNILIILPCLENINMNIWWEFQVSLRFHVAIIYILYTINSSIQLFCTLIGKYYYYYYWFKFHIILRIQ